jgi:2-polyprenyl-6-methoxyphenol hydroxylase-like FAD-dependent oxidoreductase
MFCQFKNVVIVGGGIGGLALAIELQDLGIKSTVFESRPKGYSVGGSMVLTPNALRVCDRLGIYSQLREEGFAHDGGEIVNTKGELIGNLVLGSEKLFGYPALRLYRTFLRETLLTKAESRGVKVKYDMRCVSVIESVAGGSVVLEFANGEEVEGDLVIGSDGIHSALRQYIDPQNSEPTFSGQLAVCGFAPRDMVTASDVEKVEMILGSKGSFARMPAAGKDNDILFFSTLEVPDRSQEEWRMLMDNKTELLGLLEKFSSEEWPDIVRGLIRDAPKEKYYGFP